MFAAIAKKRTNDLTTRFICNYLRFMRAAIFLSQIKWPLFFLGRSTGLSVTSINTASNWFSYFNNDFFQVNENGNRWSKYPLILLLSHKHDSPKYRTQRQYETVYGTRDSTSKVTATYLHCLTWQIRHGWDAYAKLLLIRLTLSAFV